MRKICTMALLALAIGVPAAAEEGGTDMAAMEGAWAKAATPGEWHEFLARSTGNWEHESKMWMQPGGEPMLSEGKVSYEMILGGRYLHESFQGETMGQPFEGLAITGYDNTTGMVTTTWFDTMGTATTILAGKAGDPGAPLEQSGKTVDPMSGMEMTIRTVTTFTGEDSKMFEYFMSAQGMPEMKVMEITYTRAK